MKAVIIEDEIQAIKALKHELTTHCSGVNICGVAATFLEAKKLISKTNPELVFLDIQLKDCNGFDLLKRLDRNNFKVIFTTAYSQYALNAIKISALDYLLKPIDGKELAEAVNKAKQNTLESTQLKIKNLVENEVLNPLRKKIAIQTSKGVFLHELKSIVRLQSDGNYTVIFLTNEKKLIVTKILKEFEESLNNLGFIRIHHSHIINLNYLESYMNSDGGYVILKNKTTLPVSKRKKSHLLTLLNNIHT